MVNSRTLDREFVYFKAIIANLFDPLTTTGFELGPFDRPFFTRDEAKVEFLDYRTTQELRAYAAVAPGHSAEFVVDVDYVATGSGDWSHVPDNRYDWMISAHVLEHTPNLIGFLDTMGRKLRPGGLIISLLPDKRATFDVYRPLTSLGRIVEDYLTDAKSPRIASVFDAFYHGRNASITEANQLERNSYDLLESNDNIEAALAEARKAQTQYYDAHNYVFTSETFYQHINQICRAGLLPFTCTSHLPTQRGYMSFLNVLRKVG